DDCIEGYLSHWLTHLAGLCDHKETLPQTHSIAL
ncbi:MAG: hypothetical protein ACI9K1_002693, partial [Arcticibacterium sp.]